MIAVPDLINGSYEALGGFMIAFSIVRLHRDKIVRGVSWVPVAFYASWGYWNLFYYPHLGQWVSFFGGVGVVAVNTVWLTQMIYYIRREAKQQKEVPHDRL